MNPLREPKTPVSTTATKLSAAPPASAATDQKTSAVAKSYFSMLKSSLLATFHWVWPTTALTIGSYLIINQFQSMTLKTGLACFAVAAVAVTITKYFMSRKANSSQLQNNGLDNGLGSPTPSVSLNPKAATPPSRSAQLITAKKDPSRNLEMPETTQQLLPSTTLSTGAPQLEQNNSAAPAPSAPPLGGNSSLQLKPTHLLASIKAAIPSAAPPRKEPESLRNPVVPVMPKTLLQSIIDRTASLKPVGYRERSAPATSRALPIQIQGSSLIKFPFRDSKAPRPPTHAVAQAKVSTDKDRPLTVHTTSVRVPGSTQPLAAASVKTLIQPLPPSPPPVLNTDSPNPYSPLGLPNAGGNLDDKELANILAPQPTASISSAPVLAPPTASRGRSSTHSKKPLGASFASTVLSPQMPAGLHPAPASETGSSPASAWLEPSTAAPAPAPAARAPTPIPTRATTRSAATAPLIDEPAQLPQAAGGSSRGGHRKKTHRTTKAL